MANPLTLEQISVEEATLYGAETLAVACDRVEEVSTKAVLKRAAFAAAESYAHAGKMFWNVRKFEQAAKAYDAASTYYHRAGYWIRRDNAKLTRDIMRCRARELDKVFATEEPR